eukprot:4541650-Prymnesium_polylepis.1
MDSLAGSMQLTNHSYCPLALPSGLFCAYDGIMCAPTGGFTVRQVGGTILLPALRNFLNGFGCRVRSGSQVPVGLFDRNDAAVQALKDEYVVFVIDQQTWLQGYMAAASAALAATLNMTIALPPAPDILAT